MKRIVFILFIGLLAFQHNAVAQQSAKKALKAEIKSQQIKKIENQRAEAFTHQLNQRLHLNGTQTTQVARINKKAADRLHEIKSRNYSNLNKKYTDVSRVYKNQRNSIKKVLSAKQKQMMHVRANKELK